MTDVPVPDGLAPPSASGGAGGGGGRVTPRNDSGDVSGAFVAALAIAVLLCLAAIVWLWFRCSDAPSVDQLINGAKQLADEVRS